MTTKTYSVCILTTYAMHLNRNEPYWVTNWYQYGRKTDIDHDKCRANGHLAYGVMFGHNSRNLTSARRREILWVDEELIAQHKGGAVREAFDWLAMKRTVSDD